MVESSRYLFFGTWVLARQWARRHGVNEHHVILPYNAAERLRGLRSRIVLVETHAYPQGGDVERWGAAAEEARRLNTMNGFETTIEEA